MPTYKQKKQKLRALVKQQQQQRINKIKQQGHNYVDSDAFKRSEKHYKYYKHRQTDWSQVLKLEQMKKIVIDGKDVYKLDFPEGAYLVKKFNNIQQQYQIGFQALNRYVYRPYRTNLDGTNGLYQLQKQQVMEENQEVFPEEVKDQKGNVLYYFNEKIRMTNLGYQYDWPKRSYPSTKVQTPSTILKMTDKAVSLFEKITGQKLDYSGQAVIVNFYKPKDYMTGHLDDGELDQQNPIFSFCFGLSCIFLLGGPTRSTPPIAIQLQAGDLMIMSGFSRRCFHGVPRIIDGSFERVKGPQGEAGVRVEIDGDWGALEVKNGVGEVGNYFERHRLNVNVRQVYPKGVKGGEEEGKEEIGNCLESGDVQEEKEGLGKNEEKNEGNLNSGEDQNKLNKNEKVDSERVSVK